MNKENGLRRYREHLQGKLDTLIEIESHVHYGEPPPPCRDPFVIVKRDSPVLLSAPHGARTFRNEENERWHEEDEYTAGMALLLGQLCNTSVIATVWRTDDCDPNTHYEECCAYKGAMRKLVREKNIRYVIDLHGAASHHPWLVDLGTRYDKDDKDDKRPSLDCSHRKRLKKCIVDRLGEGALSKGNVNGAKDKGRVTAFAQEGLDLQAVQIEMNSRVRIPFRRTDASRFAIDGPFSAEPSKVVGMMQALVEFISYLKTT